MGGPRASVAAASTAAALGGGLMQCRAGGPRRCAGNDSRRAGKEERRRAEGLAGRVPVRSKLPRLLFAAGKRAEAGRRASRSRSSCPVGSRRGGGDDLPPCSALAERVPPWRCILAVCRGLARSPERGVTLSDAVDAVSL